LKIFTDELEKVYRIFQEKKYFCLIKTYISSFFACSLFKRFADKEKEILFKKFKDFEGKVA
jgi:hypothetical protein